MTTRLPSFPCPYPREVFGGLVLRALEMYGVETNRQCLYNMFGARISDIAGIPTAMQELTERLPLGWEGRVESITDDHTIWPFYRPFLPRDVATRAWRRITHGPKGALQLVLGDSTSRLPGHRRLKFCAACAADDEAEVGRPYYHVDHQLPVIQVCERHGLPLTQVGAAIPGPGAFNAARQIHGELPTAVGVGGEERLSNFANALINARLPNLDHRLLVDAYLERLKALDLVTRAGRIRYKFLIDRMEETYSNDCLSRLSKSRDEIQQWIHSILFNCSRGHHPIKHLLVIGAIYGSFGEFLRGAKQLELPFHSLAKFDQKPDVHEAIRTALNDPAASMTTIARRSKVTVTTCVTHAKRLGIVVKTRPKILTPKEEAKIQRLAAHGWSAQTIANRSSVSVVTVYRAIRSNLSAEHTWKEARANNERKRHRLVWTRKLKATTGAGVNTLRGQAQATYAWLYRHDREWLNGHKPTRTKQTS